MQPETDVYRCLAETLDARLRSLSADVPGDGSAGTQGKDQIRLLEVDRTTVRLHSQLADRPVTYGHAMFCQECGEPAPCTTIRRLSEQYGCDDIATSGGS